MQTNDNLVRKVLQKRYRIDKLLGKGGQGSVYCATDITASIDTKYAVKQFIPNYDDSSSLEVGTRLFAQEAEILQKLGKHPQIPHIYDYFTEGKRFYLVQEWINGQNLYREFTNKKYFTESETIELLQDVLTVLKFVHQNKYIHRDIKPANLIRNKYGQKICLIDFGTVKERIDPENIDRQGNYTRTAVIKSPGYTPIEQLRSTPEFCSDLYALGMVAIEALTGIHPTQIPLDDRNNPMWRGHIPTSDRNLNPNFLNLLDRMVRGQYKERYQSAAEVLKDLNQIHHNTVPFPETVRDGDPTVTDLSTSKSKKPLLPRLVIGLSTLAVAIGALFLANTEETEEYVVYENAEYGIELERPKTWSIKEEWMTLQPGVTFLSPLENNTDNFQENITVSLENLVRPLSLNEYTEQAAVQIEGSNTIVEQPTETTFANREARKIVYQEKDGNKKRMEVWMIKKQKAYIATYTAESEKFDKFAKQAERIIESLVVGK